MIINNYSKRSKSEKEEIENMLSEEFDSMYNLKISDASLSSSRYDIMITLSRVLMKILKLIGMSDIKETYNNDSIVVPFANRDMMRQTVSFKIIETKRIDRMIHYSYFGLLLDSNGVTRTFNNWKDLKRMIKETEIKENVYHMDRELEGE